MCGPVLATLTSVESGVWGWGGGGGSCGCYFVTCVEDGVFQEFCICDFGWTAIGGGGGGGGVCRVWSCTCYFDFCWEWCVGVGGGGGSCFCDSFGWRNVCVLYWWLTLRSVCVLPVLETWGLCVCVQYLHWGLCWCPVLVTWGLCVCVCVSSTYTEGFVGAQFL